MEESDETRDSAQPSAVDSDGRQPELIGHIIRRVMDRVLAAMAQIPPATEYAASIRAEVAGHSLPGEAHTVSRGADMNGNGGADGEECIAPPDGRDSRRG